MISLITSHNKNPMNNFERIDWKHQKPQISIGSKLSIKCMKKCMKDENEWKMKGKKVLPAVEDKNPWKFLREKRKKKKNLALILTDWRERERNNFWKSLNSDRTREKLMILKTLWSIFDWSKITFVWSSSNRASIKPSRFKPKF